MKIARRIVLILAVVAMLVAGMVIPASAADTTPVATFEFGANGSASHSDGSTATSYDETNNGYTLTLNSLSNVYKNARDAKGNSCIKLGTGSKAGSFSFTVPNDVTSVVISIAKYKSNSATIKINNTTTKTLTKNSNDGAYDEIVVDTSSTKTVSLAVSSGYRAMVNKITFFVPAAESDCEHTYSDATCTTPATCTKCGDIDGDALGHSYGAGVETTAPDCTTDGVKTYTCSICDNVKTEAIKATGHTYVNGTCSVCGAEEPKVQSTTMNIYANQGTMGNKTISWTSGLVTVTNNQASSTSAILTTDTNLFRAYAKSQLVFSAKGQNIYKIVITCTSSDYATAMKNSATSAGYTATASGSVVTIDLGEGVDEVKFSLSAQSRLNKVEVTYEDCDHANATTVTTPATCTTAGSTTVTCGDCGETVVTEIPALGHKEVTDSAVAPTCTETGFTEGSHCSVCGEIFVAQKEVAALGHEFVNGECTREGCDAKKDCTHTNTTTETVESTCIVAGSVTVICVDCGNTVSTEELPFADHTAVPVDAKAPTCTETGLTEGSECSVCGETLEEQTTVDALGHVYDFKTLQCINDGCTEKLVTETWDLVTDVTQLSAGDRIVIVAVNSDVALSTTQNSNNRGQASVTKNGNTVTFGDNVQILTLEAGTVDGTFAFYTGSGYLYAASSGSNHLKTQTTNNGNGSWTITIENGKATIKANGGYTRNWLRHNSTSSLFSCYSSGQQDVAIYKCNKTDIEVPTINGVSLNIGNDLGMNVYTDYEGGLTFTLGNKEVVATYDSEKGRYTFDGITPNDLGTKVIISATVGGYAFYKEYSILDYCETYATKGSSEEMKYLLAALMVYGDATRAFNDLDATATTLLEGAYADYADYYSADSIEFINYTGEWVNDNSFGFKGAYLVLNSKTDVAFTLANAENTSVKLNWVKINGVELNEGEYKFDGATITVYDVRATEFNVPVAAEITVTDAEDVEHTYTIYYSVNMYCAAMAEDADLATLVRAIYSYGKAAEAYVASKAD